MHYLAILSHFWIYKRYKYKSLIKNSVYMILISKFPVSKFVILIFKEFKNIYSQYLSTIITKSIFNNRNYYLFEEKYLDNHEINNLFASYLIQKFTIYYQVYLFLQLCK